MRMHFKKKIKIGPYEINETSKTFIIAEAGINHGGNMRIAKKLIDLASQAGSDAVKFQAFKTENFILNNVKKAAYQRKVTDPEESQFSMLKSLEFTKEQNKELSNYCKKRKIMFLTTPFEEQSLDSLDDLDLPAYKISSTDLTNLPFLKKVAKKGKPILLSTGMSYIEEVNTALKEIYPFNKQVILLQCTSCYPATESDANLNIINTYKNKFDILVGYSDHTAGIGAAPYAVVMGARVIEKHFTLSKKLSGPDHKASLDPKELKGIIIEIRKIDQLLGKRIKMPTSSEKENRSSLQKCLVAAKEIKKGDYFSEDNIVGKRTGGVGISPVYYRKIVSKRAKKTFLKDEVILI